MSREKGKVIHVDKLTIHAKEVEIIQERPEGHHEDRRHPFDFFSPRRRLGREFEKEKHNEEESSSEEGRNEGHRGPRWL
ncbi:hypothetical protein G3A_09910 [Bacillus sp. 17376]|uniref:Uncharacterized protein n=1 Tax=Mesobacillus boroniphilus JCM 21738 TaxID=1294265 RepID=W4RT14_9BACI|nr:hypothetical protein [Mesobacillus boroniphilus]ESU32709.1 hypothetical protein G3A_09910 [Bacillus sp. 17376]GAE47003.1 hypothetical protein JCM21738_3941 [Mesobacillus boroniphilus JCM 21738]